MEWSNRDNTREARHAAEQAQKNSYMATLAAIRIVHEIHTAFGIFGILLGVYFAASYVGHAYLFPLSVAYMLLSAYVGIRATVKANEIRL